MNQSEFDLGLSLVVQELNLAISPHHVTIVNKEIHLTMNSTLAVKGVLAYYDNLSGFELRHPFMVASGNLADMYEDILKELFYIMPPNIKQQLELNE